MIDFLFKTLILVVLFILWRATIIEMVFIVVIANTIVDLWIIRCSIDSRKGKGL